MTIKTRPVTAEELLRKPDDGFRHELVRGKLRKITPAGDEHGYVAGEIFGELRSYVKANNLGRTYAAETGFRISSNPEHGARPRRGLCEP
jgi:Uma2 family endonuclease